MPYEGNPDAPTGPTQPGGGLASSWYPQSAVQASGTNYTYTPPAGAAAAGAPPTGATGAPLAGGGGAPPTGQSPYNPGDVIIGNDGRMGIYARHYDPASGQYLYGFTYFPQPGTPEFEANGGWATVEQQTGIQATFIDAAYRTAKTNYDQTQGAAARLGQFSVIGRNDDGSLKVRDGRGNIADISRADIAAGRYPGIAVSDFDDATSRWESQTSQHNRMGQFTVIGRNADGSLQVRDGLNQIATITRDMVAAGQVPGVTISDFDDADARALNDQRTLAEGKQWKVLSANNDGTLTIQRGDGHIDTININGANLADVATQYPGITATAIQEAQGRQVDAAWQQGDAFGPQFQSAMPGGTTPPPSAPAPGSGATPPPGTPPGAMPPPMPNPTPPPGTPPAMAPTPNPAYGVPVTGNPGDPYGRGGGAPGMSTAMGGDGGASAAVMGAGREGMAPVAGMQAYTGGRDGMTPMPGMQAYTGAGRAGMTPMAGGAAPDMATAQGASPDVYGAQTGAGRQGMTPMPGMTPYTGTGRDGMAPAAGMTPYTGTGRAGMSSAASMVATPQMQAQYRATSASPMAKSATTLPSLAVQTQGKPEPAPTTGQGMPGLGTGGGLGVGKPENQPPVLFGGGTAMPTTAQGMGAPQMATTYAATSSTPTSMTNQQLQLRNQTYANLQRYVTAGNTGSRNLGGMGFAALGRPQIAGQ